MRMSITEFIGNEQGQDLIEYTLLPAFVALASVARFIGRRQQRQGHFGRRQHATYSG